MSIKAGPQLVTRASTSGLGDVDDIAFYIDPLNNNSTPNIGCGAYNSDRQVKNLINRALASSYGNVLLSNRTFYTAFAIDYPEGNYGGDAAGRHGITPGFNVRTGTKTYTTGRALHLYAWDESASAWIEGGLFTGAYGSGHVYDNYTGAEVGYASELTKFASDYNKIKAIYPNVTFVAIGSHRADRYTQTVRDILTDLGKPTSFIDSDYIAAPEWILIGKPGLGAGNYYGWAYENYTTNPTLVAHLNFGLPVTAKGNYTFTGSESLTFGAVTGDFTRFTVSVWFNSNSVTNYRNVLDCQWNYYGAATGNVGPRLEQISGGILAWAMSGDSAVNANYNGYNYPSTISANTWYNAVITRIPGSVNTYLNGATALTNQTNSQGFVNAMNNVTIGRGFALGGSERYFSGNIGPVTIYREALTAAQVLQNFNATKGRFGL